MLGAGQLLRQSADCNPGRLFEGKYVSSGGNRRESHRVHSQFVGYAERLAIGAGEMLGMPFVDGRWIGGTLTNFGQIKKRVEKLERLTSEREKGELAKYTKKERLLIDREIANLDRFFSGIIPMKELPKVLFVVDPKKEYTAVKEAQDLGIPVIALAGSDCDISIIEYPIVGNDASKSSITFFVGEMVKAYEAGKVLAKAAAPAAPKDASVSEGAVTPKL